MRTFRNNDLSSVSDVNELASLSVVMGSEYNRDLSRPFTLPSSQCSVADSNHFLPRTGMTHASERITITVLRVDDSSFKIDKNSISM